MPIPRNLRQALAAVVIIGIVVVVIASFVLRDIGAENTNPNNQIPTLDLQVPFARFFQEQPSGYDFVASIVNPNSEFGASAIQYSIVFLDSQRTPVFEKLGTTFILPGEQKYIVESPLRVSQQVADVRFDILGVQWEFVPKYVNTSELFSVQQVRLEQTPSGAAVRGEFFNKSLFNFQSVDIPVVLFDQRQQPIAAGITDGQTVLSGEARFFEVFWARSFDPQNTVIDVGVYTNVFQNLNFIKEFKDPERFQQLLKLQQAIGSK